MGVAVASDSFTDGDETGWCKLLPAPTDEIVFEQQGVTLRAVESAWYDDSLGPFVYRNIAKQENFVVVTRLYVTDGDGQTLATFRHGAGLLVREPHPDRRPESENWVKLSVGYTSPTALGVAWDATTHGETKALDVYLEGTFKAIAICRADTLFSFFGYVGPDWVPVPASNEGVTQHAPLTNSELIQVGLVAHAAPNVPGAVVAKARYVDFIPVTTTCADALPPKPLDAN
jgi:hypothetical protein